MGNYFKLLCLGLLMLTAGCSDTKVMPPGGRYMVVTRFGNGMLIEKIGTTPVLNDDFRIYEDDTDVGKLFRDAIVKTLSEDPSWTYVPTEVPMDDPKTDGDVGDYLSSMNDNWHKVAARTKKVKAAAAANHADLVIYVTEDDGSGSGFARPFADAIGRGMYKRAWLGVEEQNYTYISYDIVIYDAHTWKSRSYATTVQNTFHQFAWPTFQKGSVHIGPIPDTVIQNVRDSLPDIEPPRDLTFALCYLGLTTLTQDSNAQTRAYTCAQHYESQILNSYMSVPIYWLSHADNIDRQKIGP
jgi:hypothetical protein